jgi:hypothetical protein
LFMSTFRTHKGDYCDSVATWWTAYWYVCPAVHHPNGLFICFCSANLPPIMASQSDAGAQDRGRRATKLLQSEATSAYPRCHRSLSGHPSAKF